MPVNFSFMKVTIERLEQVLEEIGVKKADFMSHFNLSKQNYQHWKERGIPGNKIIPICTFLEIDLDRLTNNKSTAQADRKDLHDEIDRLPAHLLDKARHLLEYVKDTEERPTEGHPKAVRKKL